MRRLGIRMRAGAGVLDLRQPVAKAQHRLFQQIDFLALLTYNIGKSIDLARLMSAEFFEGLQSVAVGHCGSQMNRLQKSVTQRRMEGLPESKALG